jgi:hypothetical protein
MSIPRTGLQRVTTVRRRARRFVRAWGRRVLILGICFSAAACSPRLPQYDGMAYPDFLRSIQVPDRMARLDVPGAEIVTSYDRTGANHDFNGFVGREDGWVVLADLKGPGYVSRFWCTGIQDDHRLRLFFDGERRPRLDTTLGAMRAEPFPFHPTLAYYDQACWTSFVPIPYGRRLRILAEDKGYETGDKWPRFFYQINYVPLPAERTPGSLPESFSQEDEAALVVFGEALNDPPGVGGGAQTNRFETRLQPGSDQVLTQLQGPAVLRDLRIRVIPDEALPMPARLTLPRNLILSIIWDGADTPSVEIPVGHIGGSLWQRINAESRYFATDGYAFRSRWPMPFRERAELQLRNESGYAVSVGVETVHAPHADLTGYGYFHAARQRSTPGDRGRPHQILRAMGRGKYVGCVLAVDSLDKSWWILEGDEYMRRDGEPEVFWHGTGLEDYFNGGWYYKNNFLRPLHGLIYKAPFRTVQYRLHLYDAPTFNEALDVRIERGPDNASRGFMESVAFFYADAAGASGSQIGTPADRTPPENPIDQGTIMSALCNFERVADYSGASEYIDDYLERFSDVPFAAVLRLRQAAYVERVDGIDAARPLYESFLSEDADAVARNFAKLLLWVHEDPSHAILSFSSRNPATVFLDGNAIGTVSDPRAFQVFPVRLTQGRHAVAVETTKRQYPEWVQVCIRTRDGIVMKTDRDWLSQVRPEGAWKQPDYDASHWAPTGDSYKEGPPAVPYIWTTPHPLVDMQAIPKAIWISVDAQPGVCVCLRKAFSLPLVHMAKDSDR